MDFLLKNISIISWNKFGDGWWTKFGDDHTTATLINNLSNIKANPNEKIKDFNSRFNELLNKIPDTYKPGFDVQIEWYISILPTNITIFIVRANRATLVDNMKESIDVAKEILSLEKKTAQEERKSKKATFKEEPKKKTPKYPFDLEGLQNVLKSMSNDMVDIKK